MSAITIIESVPKFVSVDEHKIIVSTTPASFSDIPPILRHKEENVKLALHPPLDGFSSSDSQNGTLYVIESILVFMSINGRGIQIEYPSITLHAISRADNAPSIYCQLDDAVPTTNKDDDLAEMREMNIIPSAAASLEPIFEALSLCASLHPDPKDSDDDAMDADADDAFVVAGDSPFETFNGDENQELSEVGRAALEHLESIIDYGDHAPADTEEKEAKVTTQES